MTLAALFLCLVPAMSDSVANLTAASPSDSGDKAIALPAAGQDSAHAPDSARSAPDSAIASSDSLPAAKSDSVPHAAATPEVLPGPVVVPAPPAGPIGPVVGPIGPVGPSGPVVYGPTTIVSIDTSGSGTSDRSTLGAIGRSLLLPGWGHRYLGYRRNAIPYVSTDLAAWAGLFGSWLVGKSALANAANIANRHAGADLGSDPDPELVSAIRSYRSRRATMGRHDSYNEAMLLSGKDEQWQFPDDDAHNWDWGTRENPENDAHIRAFEDEVKIWRGTRVAIYSTVGVLALVRVVATMDVLRLTRSAASRAGIALETRPIPGGMDATLAVNF